MGHVSMEELLKHNRSVYKLVVAAARRAKQLSEGAPKLVEGDFKKFASVALEELRQGRVICKVEEPTDGAKPKGRKKKEG